MSESDIKEKRPLSDSIGQMGPVIGIRWVGSFDRESVHRKEQRYINTACCYRSGRQIEDFGSYLLRDTLLLTKLIKICVIYINYFDRVIK